MIYRVKIDLQENPRHSLLPPRPMAMNFSY